MYYIGKDFKELKKLGFILLPQRDYYQIKTDQYTLFIPTRYKNEDFEYRKVYIEINDYNMIIDDLDIIYTLIESGLFNKEL